MELRRAQFRISALDAQVAKITAQFETKALSHAKEIEEKDNIILQLEKCVASLKIHAAEQNVEGVIEHQLARKDHDVSCEPEAPYHIERKVLEAEIMLLKNQLEEARQDATNEISLRGSKLIESDATIQELRKDLVDQQELLDRETIVLNETISALKDELLRAEKDAVTLQKSCVDSQKVILILNKQLAELTESHRVMNEEFSQLRIDAAEVLQIGANAQTETQTLKQSNDRLSCELEAFKGSCARMEGLLEEMTMKYDALSKDFDSKQMEWSLNNFPRDEFLSLTSSNSILKTQFDALQAKSLDIISDNQNREVFLQELFLEKTRDIKDLERLVRKLTQLNSETSTEFANSSEQFYDRFGRISSEAENFKEAVFLLNSVSQNAVFELEHQNSLHRSEAISASTTSELLEHEITVLKKELQNACQSKEDLEKLSDSTIDKFRTEYEQYSQAIVEKDQLIESLNGNISVIRNEYNSLVVTSRSAENDLLESNKVLSHELHSLTELNSTLQASLLVALSHKEQLLCAAEAYRCQNDEIAEDRMTLTSKIIHLQNLIADVSKENEDLKFNILGQISSSLAAKETCSNVSALLSVLQSAFWNNKAEDTVQREILTTKLYTANNEIAIIGQQMEDLQATTVSLTEEINHLKAAKELVESALTEHATNLSKSEQLERQSHDLINCLKAQVTGLQNQFQDAVLSIHKFRFHLEQEPATALDFFEDSSGDLGAAIQSMARCWVACISDVSQLEARVSELSITCSGKDTCIFQLQSERDDICEKATSLEKIIVAIEGEFVSIQKKSSWYLDKEREDARQLNENLRKLLEQSHQFRYSAEKEVLRLSDMLRSLKRSIAEHTEQVSVLKNENQRIANESTRLTMDLIAAKNDLAIREEEWSLQQNRVVSEKVDVEQRCEELQKNLDRVQDNVKLLVDKLAALSSKEEACTAQLNTLQSDNLDLQKQVSQLNEQVCLSKVPTPKKVSAAGRITQLFSPAKSLDSSQFSRMKSLMSSNDEEKGKLMEQMHEMQVSHCQELQNLKDSLQKEHDLVVRLTKYKSHLSELNALIQERIEQESELRRRLVHAEDVIAGLCHATDNMQLFVAQRTEFSNENWDKKHSFIANMSTLMCDTNSKLIDMEHSVFELDVALEEAQRDVSQYHQCAQDMEDEMLELQVQRDQAFEELKKCASSTDLELSRAEAELIATESLTELAVASDNLEQARSKIISLGDALNAAYSEINDISRTMSTLENRVLEVSAESSSWQARCDVMLIGTCGERNVVNATNIGSVGVLLLNLSEELIEANDRCHNQVVENHALRNEATRLGQKLDQSAIDQEQLSNNFAQTQAFAIVATNGLVGAETLISELVEANNYIPALRAELSNTYMQLNDMEIEMGELSFQKYAYNKENSHLSGQTHQGTECVTVKWLKMLYRVEEQLVINEEKFSRVKGSMAARIAAEETRSAALTAQCDRFSNEVDTLRGELSILNAEKENTEQALQLEMRCLRNENELRVNSYSSALSDSQDQISRNRVEIDELSTTIKALQAQCKSNRDEVPDKSLEDDEPTMQENCPLDDISSDKIKLNELVTKTRKMQKQIRILEAKNRMLEKKLVPAVPVADIPTIRSPLADIRKDI